MYLQDLRSLPKEVQDFIWDVISDFNYAIAEEYAMSAEQLQFISKIEDDIILKKTSVLDLPREMEKMPGSFEGDFRKLSLKMATDIFWPLQEYLQNVDRLIMRLGGKVPHIKPLKPSDKQSDANVFPGEAVGTLKEMIARYEDFKDLRLSNNKIINEKGFLTAPTVDNWLKDYVHFVGAGSHDSLTRAQYLSKAPNVLELDKEQSESLRYFLVSYDEDVPMTFDYLDLVLKVSEPVKQNISIQKKDTNHDANTAINEIEKKVRELLENVLPEDIIMSEAENDINKVRDILWQSIGIQDKDKAISCLGLMIKKRALDQAIREDNRFKNILKRFVGVKYGHSLEQAIGQEIDKLILRRLFLEMILSEKFHLPEEEMFITAFYLSNIVPGSGQIVYFDKKHSQLKWRELQTMGNKFSWVFPIN